MGYLFAASIIFTACSEFAAKENATILKCGARTGKEAFRLIYYSRTFFKVTGLDWVMSNYLNSLSVLNYYQCLNPGCGKNYSVYEKDLTKMKGFGHFDVLCQKHF